MKLGTLGSRLLVSHVTLVFLIAVALAATVQGVLRMTHLITLVRQETLSNLDSEEAVHRAAWAVEVASRHSHEACEKGEEPRAIRVMTEARDRLREALAKEESNVAKAIATSAQGYLEFANRMLRERTCAQILDPAQERSHFLLDEKLTNAWIERQREFIGDVRAKEDEARSIGSTAASLGFAVALIAAVVAVIVARSTAASVTAPIRELGRAATRLGEGDFKPILSPQGPSEVRELARDLERMRLRLQEIDGLKQSFLGNVSHELRTPLARLRESLSLLDDPVHGDLSATQRRILELARRACEEEVRLVSALLDFSRLRSKQPIQAQARVSLTEVVNVAIASEAATAERRGVKLNGTVETVRISAADPELLERAVANLVRNAISVSHAGTGIDISLTHADGVAQIRVRDSGPGVPGEIRDTLFEPFATAPVMGEARLMSLGLGLAFAREVALAHGGSIALEKTDGNGSTFCLSLPETVEP